MVIKLLILQSYNFTQKIIIYVKDERPNLQTCANALTFIVSWNNLALLEPFDGLCLGCAFSKVCQYATIDNKVYVGVPCTSIKVAQDVISWPNFFGKRKQAWDKTWIELNWNVK